MDDHLTAYSDVKFDHSKRQKHGDKVAQKEMIMYSELMFQKPSEQKRSTRPQRAEGRGADGNLRNKDPSVSSLQWRLTAVIFGILCLILLVATGVLGITVMELSQEKKDPTQCLKSCPDPNRSVSGLPPDQSPDKEKCLVRWSHKEKRSYLFSSENRAWAQCNSFCSSHSASLLKIDSHAELDFTRKESFEYSEERGSATYYYPFWTGLSYNSETKTWVWADGTALSPGLINDLVPSPGTCVYVQSAAFKQDTCEQTRFCICVKKKAPGTN